VFQADFSRSEAQGFSLSNGLPYAIVVTTKDPPTARCFTLFHEFAHLLLREGGICLTTEAPVTEEDSLDVTESWCHRFAEAFLVDRDTLERRYETRSVLKQEPGFQEDLRRLAGLFSVSQHVILFRLLHLRLLSVQRFWTEYERVKEETEAALARQRVRQREKGGGPPPARQTVQQRGRLFTRLVLEGLDRQIVTHTEVATYLDVQLKHLEKVRFEAYK
jgi:Zn-dependent peptidase ImmA (M78 family)